MHGAALWTTVGFVCGAVFWHAVGFWTFMSEMVLNGDAVAAAHEAERSSDLIETGSLPTIYRVDPASCTSLELNRASNTTEIRPCPAEGIALRLDSDETRGDLAVVADNIVR